MRRFALAVAILLVPATALAGSPSLAEAKTAATAWLTALAVGEDAPHLDALDDLTALPFAWAADDDRGVRCPPSSSNSSKKVLDGVYCLAAVLKEEAASATFRPHKRGDLGTLYQTEIKGVESITNATFVHGRADCSARGPSTEAEIVIAVVLDGSTPKVAGIFVASKKCGP